VPRLLPTVLVLAVLAGSAVAFAVTESLKLEQRPITPTEVTKTFSPVCQCPSSRAVIDFRLREPDTVALSIVDADNREVRRLVDGRRLRGGSTIHHFTWDGRDDEGLQLPEGSYRPKVTIDEADRTFLLPNPIRIDVTSPRLRVLDVRPRVFSPDGDSHSDGITISYRVSEHANALLLVNGRQRVRKRGKPLQGELRWYGEARGRKLPPGTYALALVAVDSAGNRSRPVSAGRARLRYLDLPDTLRAEPGTTIRIPVETDARVVRFTLRRGSSVVTRGRSSPPLRLQAPLRPGRYVLAVAAAGHERRAALVVAR
jgi:hypothetical protein